MRTAPSIAVIGIALLSVVAGCGSPERPKFNIKREPHIEPLPVPEAKEIYEEPAPATATDAVIVEIGAFKGSCEHTFSGINQQDLLALANSTGLRSYRLAGIAIPPEVQAGAHDQLRTWMDGEAIGVEIEGSAASLDPAAYLYRCSTKSMVNVELVRAGFAVVVDAPSAHRDALNQASMEALAARRGVWGRK